MAEVILSAYGANRPYEGALAAPFVKLAGTNNLYRSNKGPAGLLYRPITDIRQALSCGGLMLMNGDGAVWQFWVGQDLIDAMTWEQVGKRPKFIRRAADINPSGHHGWTGPNVSSSNVVVIPSVDVRLVLDKAATFDQSGVVYAAGIVTAAQYGMGSTVFPGFEHAQSYMATVDSIDRTFAQFMETAKTATINAAPSNIRGYYERALPIAMAAFDRRLLHPSVSVTTMWDANGALLAELEDLTLAVVSSDGTMASDISMSASQGLGYAYTHISGGVDKLNAMVADQPADKRSKWEGKGKVQGTTWGSVLGFSTGAVPRSTHTDANDGTQRSQGPLITRQRIGAGTVSHWQGSWKGFTTCGFAKGGAASAYSKMPNMSGTLQGLRCGWFRDYHMLDRSVNQLTREHLVQSPYPSLSAMVIATMGQQSMNAVAPAELATIADANAALSETTAIRGLRYSTPLIRGTLLDTIERFSDAWDAKAEELAKADN